MRNSTRTREIESRAVAKANLLHTPSADAQVARELILWARQNRVIVTDLTVGGVSLQLQDLSLAASLTPTKTSDEEIAAAGRNMYREYGGKLLDDIEAAAEQGGIDEDDDE